MIEVGHDAPDFTLLDADGQEHRLSQYRGKWVVLYFYPRDNTPGCTQQACGFRDLNEELARHDAVVLGISPDTVASHRGFADKYELPFTLLSDPDQEVCGLYGVWQEKRMYGRTHMGVVRTTYVIDPQGTVAQRLDRVKAADNPQQVLHWLSEAKQA